MLKSGRLVTGGIKVVLTCALLKITVGTSHVVGGCCQNRLLPCSKPGSIVNLSCDLALCSHSLVTVMHTYSEWKAALANGGIGRSNGECLVRNLPPSLQRGQ